MSWSSAAWQRPANVPGKVKSDTGIRRLLLALLLVCPWTTAAAAHETLERVVIVMRHGIRPPTKAKPLPDGYARQPWPAWPVPPGWLTPHGEQAIARLASFDAARYAVLLPAGCANGDVPRIVADTDERTVRTAQVYAAALVGRCPPPVENAGDGHVDPRFSPFAVTPGLDPAVALASAQAYLPAGGLAALDAANASRLALLDTVLGCCTAPVCHGSGPCHLADQPLAMDAAKERVRIIGGLATAASLAQTLLLEYADGKPMAEVGWGRVSAAQISDLSKLHALEFALVARPPAIATFGARALLGEIDAALLAPGGPRYTVFVGHDSNLSYIGGALGSHWQARGLAADDPSPGGALIFELWQTDGGKREVRLRYRSQSLDEMRDLSAMQAADSQLVAIAMCGNGGPCSAGDFHALVASFSRH